VTSPSTLPLADELSAVFARISGLLLTHETVQTALGLVTSLAQDTLPGAVGAGVSVMDEQGRRTTAGASDPVVARADTLQYELDEGPCLTAWRRRALVRVDRISTDQRWPRWAREAGELGLQSALSAPMVAGDTALGAVKVYADEPGVFDERSGRLLSMFAGQAAILLANVQSLERARRATDDLKRALRGRDVIAMAKGALMAAEGMGEDAAFTLLVSVARRENRTLRDVAEAIVASTARSPSVVRLRPPEPS
jgi:GAF domain-containing protein